MASLESTISTAPGHAAQPAEYRATAADREEKRPLVPTIQKLRRGPWLQVISNRGFEWNRVTLPVPNLPAELAGLRILHLTDLHLRPRWQSPNDELLDRISQSPPDLILITGDILEHQYKPRPALPSLHRFVSALPSRLGTFVILGNHDGDLVGPHITRAGATLINGRFVTLGDGQTTIELIGMPGVNKLDVYASDLPATIPPRPANSLRIILSHYPDTIRQLSHLGADLFLTGHTHGGQVCLPGGIPIIRHDTLPRRLCKGIHRYGDTWLIVGRGFGFATHQIRLFCPSEVMELNLASAI